MANSSVVKSINANDLPTGGGANQIIRKNSTADYDVSYSQAEVDDDGVLTVPEQASTPTAPAAGKQQIYVKTDGKLYSQSSGGESAIGVSASTATGSETAEDVSGGSAPESFASQNTTTSLQSSIASFANVPSFGRSDVSYVTGRVWINTSVVALSYFDFEVDLPSGTVLDGMSSFLDDALTLGDAVFATPGSVWNNEITIVHARMSAENRVQIILYNRHASITYSGFMEVLLFGFKVRPEGDI